jgi:hypothetical protein
LLRAIVQTRRNSRMFLVCTIISWLRIVGNQEKIWNLDVWNGIERDSKSPSRPRQVLAGSLHMVVYLAERELALREAEIESRMK